MARTRKRTPKLSVTIAGAEYELKLDLTAMKDFEDATGRSVLSFIKPIFDAIRDMTTQETTADDAALVGFNTLDRLLTEGGISAGDLQALFWACIGGQDQELSLREAGRLITPANAIEVGRGIYQAATAGLTAPVAPGEQVEETGEAERGESQAD